MANDKAKVYFNEKFQIEKSEDGKKVLLSGQAMPFDKQSRNGVVYRTNSIKENYQTLEGKPLIFNHDPSSEENIKGHVEKAEVNESGMQYEANVDPNEEKLIHKLERGDIRHVSIGAMVEKPEYDEENDVFNVSVSEFVELSIAPVPGFKDTSTKVGKQSQEVYISENFSDEETAEKLKKVVENHSETPQETEESESTESGEEKPEESQEENKSEEESEEKPEEPEESSKQDEEDDSDNDSDEEDNPEEKMKKVETSLQEAFNEIEAIKNGMNALQSKVDKLLDDEEESKETGDEQEEPNESEEPEKPEESNSSSEELTPDTSEKFEGKDVPTGNQEEKDKELLNKETESSDKQDTQVVDSEKELLKNKPY